MHGGVVCDTRKTIPTLIQQQRILPQYEHRQFTLHIFLDHSKDIRSAPFIIGYASITAQRKRGHARLQQVFASDPVAQPLLYISTRLSMRAQCSAKLSTGKATRTLTIVHESPDRLFDSQVVSAASLLQSRPWKPSKKLQILKHLKIRKSIHMLARYSVTNLRSSKRPL